LTITISDSGATRARRHGSRFTLPGLRFRCPAAAPSVCRVSATVKLGGHLLAKGSATVRPGGSIRLQLRLTHRGLKLLRRNTTLKLRAQLTVTAPNSTAHHTAKRFALKN
jgi:hypothetical protein